MTEILYLAWNRLEFTRKSFETMIANTDWTKIDRLVVYDDGSTDGTREYLEAEVKNSPVAGEMLFTRGIGPVGIMVDHIGRSRQDGVFIKLDNDVMLPPGWLAEGLGILRQQPSIDLLGIEAIRPLGPGPRRFFEAEHIGGIGFMRRRAFDRCVPTAAGRFGFTKWQTAHDDIRKGWIDPSIPVCLLNLIPFEPWISLSREYIRKGLQRDWPGPYSEECRALWEWWK